MIRTQIQLTEEQAAQLRALATQLEVSAAEVVRRLVEQATSRSAATQSREERLARALAVAGMFSSGRSDISADHDQHLADAFGR